VVAMGDWEVEGSYHRIETIYLTPKSCTSFQLSG
jgi:hypothetical protein